MLRFLSLLLALFLLTSTLSTLGLSERGHASSQVPNSAKSVLRCQGLLPPTPNCESSKLSEFESIVYDANDDHRFTPSLDTAVAGPTPATNASLTNDPKIMFRDTNGNGHWDAGESVFYNTNNTVAGRVFLYGPPTIRTDLVKVDPKIRFVDLNGNGVLDGVVAVTARLEDLGGLLPDGTQQDIAGVQLVYSYEPSLLTPLCASNPCGQVLSGQFDDWCVANPQTCNPGAGSFTYLLDNYCQAQGASPWDTVVTYTFLGKLYASSDCFVSYTAGCPPQCGIFDTGLGCDPATRNASLVGICPGDITKGGVGALSALDVLRVEYMVIGKGSTNIDQIHQAGWPNPASGTSLIDLDGRHSTDVPVALFNTTFDNLPAVDRPLTIDIIHSPVDVTIGESVRFNAKVTASPGTSIVSYHWDFGDGGVSSYQTSFHVYFAKGSYTVSLTVADNAGHNTTRTTTITVDRTVEAQPDFSLSSGPSAVWVQQGSSATSTIALTPLYGFTGTVTLSTFDLPAGITVGFSNRTVSISQPSILRISVSSSLAVGSYTVHLSGTSGSLTRSVTVEINEVDFSISETPPDFTISTASSSLSFTAGVSRTVPISIKPLYGFAGTVNLSVSSPSVLTCALDRTSVQSSGSPSTVNLNCSSNTVGDYTIVVTATGAPAPKQTALTVHVVSESTSQKPNQPTTFLGFETSMLYEIVAGIIAIVAIMGTIVALRSRTSKQKPT